MEYIQRIRLKLGHEKILIPTSAVAILNENGCVLLHLRNDSNSWGLPGGLMDIGETIMESVQREALEETGLTIKNPKLFGIFSGPKFEVKYPNGDETSSVAMGFFTEEFEGILTEGNESLRIEFFPLHALPENMNKFHRWFIEGFLEYRSNGSIHPIIN